MLIAHGPFSYICNRYLLRNKTSNFSFNQKFFLGLLALFAGILPDFDFILLIILGKPVFNHHNYFTHTPIFYLIVFPLLFVTYKAIYPRLSTNLKKLFTPEIVKTSLIVLLIGTLSHLFADLLFEHLQLLWPLSNQSFTILGNLIKNDFLTSAYLQIQMGVEVIIIGIFITLIIPAGRKRLLVGILTSIISILFFAVTVQHYLTTYNQDFPLSADGRPVFDQDKDGVLDKNDPDVNGNFVDNIIDVDNSTLSASASTIQSSDINIKDDFELLERAMFASNSPVSPVLDSFAQANNLTDKTYTQILAQYTLKCNFANKSLDSTYRLGDLFIILSKENDNVIGIGIETEDHKVVTVVNSKAIKMTYVNFVKLKSVK